MKVINKAIFAHRAQSTAHVAYIFSYLRLYSLRGHFFLAAAAHPNIYKRGMIKALQSRFSKNREREREGKTDDIPSGVCNAIISHLEAPQIYMQQCGVLFSNSARDN